MPPFHPKNCNILNIIDISRQQIKDIISTLEVNKAAGPDLISHKLLKNIKQSISKPLQILFNKLLLDQTFPQKWKHSPVNPLFKKGDKSLACNYRPISLLSCVGKQMERCVYKHLYNHLYSNHLLYEKQSGFLRGHSTVHQLIEIYHQIVSATLLPCPLIVYIVLCCKFYSCEILGNKICLNYLHNRKSNGLRSTEFGNHILP